MRRALSGVTFAGLLLGALVGRPRSASGFAGGSTVVSVIADRDDDDFDGRPDAEEDPLPPAARTDLVPLDRRFVGWTVRPITGADRARLVVDGRPLAWGKPLPPGVAVQGIAAGVVNAVVVRGAEQESLVIEVTAVTMRGGDLVDLDLARGHASLERTPPTRLEGGVDSAYDDPDALRVVFAEPSTSRASASQGGAGDQGPGVVSVESVGPGGAHVDAIARLLLSPLACGPGELAGAANGGGHAPTASSAPGALRCSASMPLRFTVDDVDRRHPLVEARSLRAELGGAIVIRRDGKKLQAVRVLGPRTSLIGQIGAFKATIRPIVLRVTPGGAPAIGGNDAGAIAALRAELALGSAIWGQCGLSFGNVDTLEVHIVDPPPSHLIAIGDDLGLPASGGEIRVRADGHPLTVPVPAGATPERVADALARVAESAGLVAVVSPNARIAPGAAGSVDVSLRRKTGALVAIEPLVVGMPLTTDPTLTVRIGSVDLTDGLQHFGDVDSMAGTLEERTLLKAVEDGDPRTVEVVVVPFFAGGGRIGESFIGSDLSSVRNVVLLDRAGIRARKSSLTLAHELGHVLLDVPGHPDDYGVDTPSQLMDSDASDASPFGPRRLTIDECVRVVRQSGPRGRMPLLDEWKLFPIRYK